MQPKNDKLEIWKEKRREFQESGLTRKVYCERNGIKESTLDYWFSRIRKLSQLMERQKSGNTSGGYVNLKGE